MSHIEELENHLLLLNISNKSRLQVYLHIHPFPDEINHHYPLGDLPFNVLKELFKATRKMHIFEDSMPYVYDREQYTVRYRCDFGHLNPEAIYPDACDWIDGLKIAKVTTWTPEKGPFVDAAMFDSA